MSPLQISPLAVEKSPAHVRGFFDSIEKAARRAAFLADFLFQGGEFRAGKELGQGDL